ncbi:MAG: hypothetical protein IJN48_00790 [Clostridia bacterium]|nr:hypothetical protein [Clostridia bacterium]
MLKPSDKKLTTHEIVVFAMLGAIMFIGDLVFEWAPNVHPITMLVMVYTLTYREKGIFPLIVYLALEAVFFGGLWLVPYFYIFPICYLVTLLLPRGMSKVKAQTCYSLVCTVFGLLFGTLYSPWQALIFMKSFELSKIVAWIAAGFPYDIVHAAGNFAASFLIIPLVTLLKRIENKKAA